MPKGQPTSYTPDTAATILHRMANGEALRAICRDPGMPPESTVRQWNMDDVHGFAAQYARAREMQAHALAEELIEISDDGRNDWMVRNAPDNPGYELNGEHVQRSRLRFEARRWAVSKILPKVYGDKIDLNHSGSIVTGNPIDVDSLTELQRRVLLDILLLPPPTIIDQEPE